MIVRSAVVLACCATLSGAGAACGGGQDCALIGCVNGLHVFVPLAAEEPVTVRVCAQGHCERLERADRSDPSTNPFWLEFDPKGPAVEATVTVRDATGRLVTAARGSGKVRLSYPNGRECGGECRNVALRVAGSRLVPP